MASSAWQPISRKCPSAPSALFPNTLVDLSPFGLALTLQGLQPNRSAVLRGRRSPRAQCLVLARPALARAAGAGFSTRSSYSSFLQGIAVVLEKPSLGGSLTRRNGVTLKHGGFKLDLWGPLCDACWDLFLGFGGWMELTLLRVSPKGAL